MEKFKMQNFLFDFDGGRLRTLAMRLPLQLKHALRTLALKFHPLKRCNRYTYSDRNLYSGIS